MALIHDIDTAEPPAKQRRSRIKPEERHREFVRKAVSLFSEVGFEAGTRELAQRLGGDPHAAGAGAAGGTAYGLATAWGARIVSGSEHIAALTGLDTAMSAADAAVTGEGRFDAQSRGGKTVGRVLDSAGRHDVFCALIAGEVEAEFTGYSISLSAMAGSAEAAMADTAGWLESAGARAAESVGQWAARIS